MHSMLSLVCLWPWPSLQAPLSNLQPTLWPFWQLPPRRQLHGRVSGDRSVGTHCRDGITFSGLACIRDCCIVPARLPAVRRDLIQERTMLDRDDVDEELQRGFGLSIDGIEPLLRAGGDAAEMKFMECCRYLWQAEGAELIEPFIEAVFNKLPDKSRCVLFQRMLTIVYLAQDAEPTPPE